MAFLGSLRPPSKWIGPIALFIVIGHGWLFLDRAVEWMDHPGTAPGESTEYATGTTAALWGIFFLLIAVILTIVASFREPGRETETDSTPSRESLPEDDPARGVAEVRLRQLDAQLERGGITQDEYLEQRQRIIDEL